MTTADQNASKSPIIANAWSFEQQMIGLIPQLRAFSRSLCRNPHTAEDVAQQALTNAWRSRDRFERGSNLKAWLFVILRNEFYSHCRRSRRESALNLDQVEHLEAPADQQLWAMHLSDTVKALHTLPPAQREALTLVGAAGLSYKEAAQICGTPVGTIKSRVTRARSAIAAILDTEASTDHRAQDEVSRSWPMASYAQGTLHS
jgi:RNA polymerase sigma-70 factor (ECF subfamily)